MTLRPLMRLVLLLTGFGFILAAWLLPLRNPPASVSVPVADAPISALPLVETKLQMLVAATTLNTGAVLTADKAEWRTVSKSDVTAGAIRKDEDEAGVNPYLGRLIIRPVAKGAPFQPEDFAALSGTGFIAQQIAPGKRAYAIAIDSKGTVTAGNFILPNDHVDILRSFNSVSGLQSEVILSNIRVLAIGQSLHGDGPTTSGETATVEVDLRQAERLATAQRTGQISLALRHPDEQDDQATIRALTIIRPSETTEKAP